MRIKLIAIAVIIVVVIVAAAIVLLPYTATSATVTLQGPIQTCPPGQNSTYFFEHVNCFGKH